MKKNAPFTVIIYLCPYANPYHFNYIHNKIPGCYKCYYRRIEPLIIQGHNKMHKIHSNKQNSKHYPKFYEITFIPFVITVILFIMFIPPHSTPLSYINKCIEMLYAYAYNISIKSKINLPNHSINQCLRIPRQV